MPVRCISFKGGEDFGLALKTRLPVGIRSQQRREYFDGGLTLECRISRPIHLTHTTFANLGGDVMDTEAGAGS